MKKQCQILSILLLFYCSTAFAQSNYSLSFNINGLKDGQYVIAHYFGATQYITKDTAICNNQKLAFEGNKPLPVGLYLLLNTPKKKVVEFVVSTEQSIEFESDTTDMVQNMVVRGSKQTELFFQYQKKMKGFADEIGMLQMVGRNNQLSNAKINSVRQQMASYNEKFTIDNKNEWITKFLQASSDIKVPNPPKRTDGKIDSTWAFRYYKAHFWDNYDFSDEALVRTPFLQKRIDRYLQNLTFQMPDSLIAAADYIIGEAKTGKQKEVLAYCIWYMTNKYENPDIVGTDAVFVHLAEKYYIGGIMPITDSSTIVGIKKKVEVLKPLLVGQIMPELNMSDTSRVARTLSSINANYTVVFFYDPVCKHCRESTPALKAFFEKYKTKNIAVYAPAVTGSPDNWKKYIAEFGIQDWVHVYDYSFRINFRNQFDVQKTPMIYVLDKDKKIIARRLPAEQLEAFIQYYEQTR